MSVVERNKAKITFEGNLQRGKSKEGDKGRADGTWHHSSSGSQRKQNILRSFLTKNKK